MLNKSAIMAGLAAATMAIAPAAYAAPSNGSAAKLSIAARASTPSKHAEKVGGGNVLWLLVAAAGLGGIIYAATHKSSP